MNWEFERRAKALGFKRIAGVDEAGRGPLAGPLVASACILPLNFNVEGIDDSKKLTERAREELFERITSTEGLLYSIAVLSPERIDEINILQATYEAMRRALSTLPEMPDYALIDGWGLPEAPCKSEGIVKGDAISFSIAAASILAKVTRDRLMSGTYEALYPGYGFSRHKGYGTKAHLEAIEKLGPSPIHRKSFEPVKSALLGRSLSAT